MSSPPISGRRRSRDDWLQMDAAGASSPTSGSHGVRVEFVSWDSDPSDSSPPARGNGEEDEYSLRPIPPWIIRSTFLTAEPGPASRKAMMGLKEVRAGDEGLPAECAVCLHDFCVEDVLRAMPCSHAFHEHCIFHWLGINHVCPLCRHALPNQQQQQDEDADDDDDGHDGYPPTP